MKHLLPSLLTLLLLTQTPALAIPFAPPVETLPVDTCRLYLTSYQLPNPEAIQQILPQAQLSYSPDRSSWNQLRITYGTQIVTLTRQRDPQRVSDEKARYIHLLPELDARRNLLITRDLGRKAAWFKQTVDIQTLDTDDPDWDKLISGLAQLWHATVLYRDEILDPRFRVLLARDQDWQTGSQIPYYASALARKQRIESLLVQRKIPIFKNLPPIVAEEELAPQSARQVMERAATLLILASSTTTLSRQDAADMLDHWGLLHELSPNERDYLTVETPSAAMQQAMNLRFESAYALFWALGVVSGRPFPGQMGDLKVLLERVKGRNFKTWFEQAQLRPRGEILDQLDLAYRLSWAKQANPTQSYKPLLDLQAPLIHEWYYALNWIVSPDNGWDKVKTEF